MWLYVVTWIVVSNFQVTEYKVTDAYGVSQIKKSDYPTIVTEQTKMSREFDNRQEAIKFIDNCPHNNLKNYYESGSYCIRFKMDSTFNDITVGVSNE